MLIPGPDLQGCRHLARGNVEKRPIRELGRKPCGDFAEGDGATVGGSNRDLVRYTMYVVAAEEQAKDAVASALADLLRNWNRVGNPHVEKPIVDPFNWARRAAISNLLKEKERGLGRIRTQLVEKRAGIAEGEADAQLTVWENQ